MMKEIKMKKGSKRPGRKPTGAPQGATNRQAKHAKVFRHLKKTKKVAWKKRLQDALKKAQGSPLERQKSPCETCQSVEILLEKQEKSEMW